MHYGICAAAAANAVALSTSGADFIEENVQSFLSPRDGDEAAWQARLGAARACGKPIPSANCFLPGNLPCVGPAVDRAAIRAWATTAFRRAAEAGMEIIVFGSAGSRNPPPGWAMDRARAQYVETLRDLGPLAFDQGVTLAVEPLNRKESSLINSLAEGAAAARDAGVPGVGLVADLFHMARDGEAWTAIREVGDVLIHVHIAERAERTPPGVAGDDFRPALRELQAVGYDGRIAVESATPDPGRWSAACLVELRRQAKDVFGR